MKVLSKITGFDSVDEYYDHQDTVARLNKINIPTLYLNALDDPCISQDLIPYSEIKKNPNLLLATTKRGGHCSHFTGGIIPY